MEQVDSGYRWIWCNLDGHGHRWRLAVSRGDHWYFAVSRGDKWYFPGLDFEDYKDGYEDKPMLAIPLPEPFRDKHGKAG